MTTSSYGHTLCTSSSEVSFSAGKEQTTLGAQPLIVAFAPNGYMVLQVDLKHMQCHNGPFIDGLPIENGDFPWLC
jgi:hypothetical protein